MVRPHTTHHGCDCIMEKLNKQEQALKQIQAVVDELWGKCFDRSARTVPIKTNFVIDQLMEIYKILQPLEIQRDGDASD